jgi:hypothetical protein
MDGDRRPRPLLHSRRLAGCFVWPLKATKPVKFCHSPQRIISPRCAHWDYGLVT